MHSIFNKKNQSMTKKITIQTYLIYLFLLIISLIILSSCSRERGCTDPFSDNFNVYAEIDDGTCIPMTAKFEGIYQVEEVCEFESYFYDMDVIATYNEPLEIVIRNFGDFGVDIFGYVDGFRLNIPFQTFFDGAQQVEISNGVGELIGSELRITYVYGENGIPIEVCELIAF